VKTRVIFAVGGIVLVGASGVAIRGQRQQQRALATLEKKMAALEAAGSEPREVAASQGASLAAVLGTQARQAAPPAAERGSPSAVAFHESAANPAAKRPFPAPAEFHRQYEDAFVRDPPDLEWAVRAKRLAEEKLPPLLPLGSSMRSFECHRSLCRLETAHTGRETYIAFVQAAFLDPAGHLWDGPTSSMPLNDNPDDGQMVTYIAREGQTFPEVVY
jgi:hypothetical protein